MPSYTEYTGAPGMPDSISHKTTTAVLLHPHHGLCFSFFRGMGYSQEFTENLKHFLAYLSQENPDVCMTLDPDPVCGRCPNNDNGMCTSFEKVKEYDRAVLRLCGLKEGDILPFDSFMNIIRAGILDAGKRKQVCSTCQWDNVCTAEQTCSEQTYTKQTYTEQAYTEQTSSEQTSPLRNPATL